MRSLLVSITAVLILATPTIAQECAPHMYSARSLTQLPRGALAIHANRQFYEVNGDCIRISKNDFRGQRLLLKFRNSFPGGLGQKQGYLRIKVVRTFSIMPSVRLKLFRHEGWFLSNDKGEPATLGLFDQVFDQGVETWNDKHGGFPNPIEMQKRLGISWHAYLDKEFQRTSTEGMNFWQLPESLSSSSKMVNFYLIRFSVIEEEGETFVHFDIGLQSSVTKIELLVSSNFEIFDRNIVFVVE